MTKEELQQLLSKNNLTQRALAEKLGTAEARVSDWIKGKRKIYNAYVILIKNLLQE